MLHQGMPTSATVIRDLRLLYLMLQYFEGRVPTEEEVARFFKIKPSRCKSLIENVVVRFDHYLEESLSATVKAVLDTVDYDGDSSVWWVVIESDHLRAHMNRVIRTTAPQSKLIQSVQDSSGTYELAHSSYVALCESIGLDPRDEPQ